MDLQQIKMKEYVQNANQKNQLLNAVKVRIDLEPFNDIIAKIVINGFKEESLLKT